jgi:ferritin-like metal-binding protein YciE
MTADTTLHNLLVDELRDMYHAERQLVKALPKLAKAASSPDLRSALESHLAETEQQVTRVEQAFALLNETARTKTCEGMLGIVEEGSAMLKEKEKGAALDAGIIAAAQKSEHYEIATYGTMMAWAKALGHDAVASLLSASLEEEKAADEKLSELAEAGLNDAASAGASSADEAEGDEEEEEDEAGEERSTRSRKQPAMAGGNGHGRSRGTRSRQTKR